MSFEIQCFEERSRRERAESRERERREEETGRRRGLVRQKEERERFKKQMSIPREKTQRQWHEDFPSTVLTVRL